MNTASKQPPLTNNSKSSESSVVCGKCKSSQVVANKKGYSFALMFKVLFSMIGVGLVGFVIVLLSLELGLGIYAIGMVLMVPLLLSLPVSILYGFVGRNSLVNGCMNCGTKWLAGNK